MRSGELMPTHTGTPSGPSAMLLDPEAFSSAKYAWQSLVDAVSFGPNRRSSRDEQVIHRALPPFATSPQCKSFGE
jgi:hypothetical protein